MSRLNAGNAGKDKTYTVDVIIWTVLVVKRTEVETELFFIHHILMFPICFSEHCIGNKKPLIIIRRILVPKVKPHDVVFQWCQPQKGLIVMLPKDNYSNSTIGTKYRSHIDKSLGLWQLIRVPKHGYALVWSPPVGKSAPTTGKGVFAFSK